MLYSVPIEINYNYNILKQEIPLTQITLFFGQLKTEILKNIYTECKNAILIPSKSYIQYGTNRPKELKKLISSNFYETVILDDIDLYWDKDNNNIDIFENIKQTQIICSAHNVDFAEYVLNKENSSIIRTRIYKNKDALELKYVVFNNKKYIKYLASEPYTKEIYGE